MEEEPLQPSLVRVLRVTPGPNEKPAKGFSWGDYEDVNLPGSSSSRRQFADGETSADGEGDDGWMVKTSRRRSEFRDQSNILILHHLLYNVLTLSPPQNSTAHPLPPPTPPTPPLPQHTTPTLIRKPRPKRSSSANAKTPPSGTRPRRRNRRRRRSGWRGWRGIRRRWRGRGSRSSGSMAVGALAEVLEGRRVGG